MRDLDFIAILILSVVAIICLVSTIIFYFYDKDLTSAVTVIGAVSVGGIMGIVSKDKNS